MTLCGVMDAVARVIVPGGQHSITMEEVLLIKSLEHVLQTYLNYT